MRIDSWLKLVPEDGLDFDVLKTMLTLPNPEYVSRKRMGYSVSGIRRSDPLYKEVGQELWIPRALVKRYGGKDASDETVEGHEVDFRSRINLGPNENQKQDQKSWVDTLLESVKQGYGAVGQADPGWGKTVAALEVIARLGKTTAVLVHKEFLMNQWAERIADCYRISQNEIGFVQQDRCDYEGKKIVMIMVQSLLARDYPQSLFDYFGTVAVDEVHRFGAVEFRRAITMFPARYRIGVTATPKRTDGLENVFFWHIGDIAVVGDRRKIKPTIQIIRTGVIPTDYDLRQMKDYKRDYSLNKIVSWLVGRDDRNRLIVDLILKAGRSGRKVLLLSGRRLHLEYLTQRLKAELAKTGERFTWGYYVGGMSERERTISATRQLLFGTYQMAAEGLDIPELDTLFLTTPKGNVEQAVGRILRDVEGKKEPTVLDFVDDSVPMCDNLARKRVRTYKRLGYMS